MFYLNENEETVIGNFIAVESKYTNRILILKWNTGAYVTATYDSFIEDENDYEIEDDEYEEFWSFVFKKLKIEGTPPIEVTEDDYFTVNYHNFPDDIVVNDIKIN